MSEPTFYDLDEIKAALVPRIDEFILTVFPNAKREAQCYKIGSIDGEKGTSMMISTRANNPGYYKDFANPDVQGKPWRLIAEKNGMSIRESIQWLANWLHLQPIQSFGNVSKSKNPEKLGREMKALTPECIAYAASRGISEATLRAYGVQSDYQGKIAFPYYDAYNRLGMVKHWGLKPKPDGKKDTWVSADPIMTLFGKDVCDPDKKIQQLIITEGEWDAMACYEIGLPAVSIPMGVSNVQWITEDYQFLSHFDDIVLLFDNDKAGEEAAKTALGRLGAERCTIVKLPLKDANDMLKSGRGKEIEVIIASSEPEPIAEIVDPSDMQESVRSYMKGEHLAEGDGFFLPGFDLSFRKHEITLWFGFTGHGKSQAVQNQVASLAAQGKMSCVASFEQPPQLTFSQILTNFTVYPNLPFTDEFEPAYKYLSQYVFMYKSMDRACPKHLVSTFIHAHKRYGIDNFVIDNVMTMNIDRGDNTAQADAADMLRMFVSKYPVHLHIVAHPRKPPESVAKPPNSSDIRGAAEWGDMPHNIITVWRDMNKAERLAEMIDDEYTQEEIRAFVASTPCGKFIVRKQRLTGSLPMTSFFFHPETKRFTSKPGEPTPFYSEKPWGKD